MAGVRQNEAVGVKSWIHGRRDGLLDGVGVAGSAAGLVLVGYLAGRWDDLGKAIAVLVFAPVLVAVVIIKWFPETASKELETFNPDDPDINKTPASTTSR